MGWLIAFGILVAIALLPIGISLKYDKDGLALRFLMGWIPISLTGGKKKGKKPKEKPKKKEKSAKKQKPTPKKPEKTEQGGSISDFLPLIKVGLDLLNQFRRKIRIRRLEMKLIMAADDPCDLAVNYGRGWAALGNLMPRLERVFVIKKRDLEIECDFEATETVILARADVVIGLGRLICMLLKYGGKAMIEFIKMKNLKKGGASK